ncbi:MAG: MBL fold metallo-hydrolase [Bacteroidales bacterium]
MKIIILGSRGEIEEKAPRHIKHSGIFIDNSILIDAGEPGYMKLHPDIVLFTHLHPDHAWFIRDNKKFEYSGPVYGPENSELIPSMKIISNSFTFRHYKIIPVPVIHSLKVKSLGYIIEKDDCKVFYTGDIAWIEKKYHELFENLDLVISDGSFISKGGMIRRDDDSGKIYGHTGIPDIIQMFSPYVSKIVFTHFGKWFMNDVPLARKKMKDLAPENIEIIIAHDRKEITIC